VALEGAHLFLGAPQDLDGVHLEDAPPPDAAQDVFQDHAVVRRQRGGQVPGVELAPPVSVQLCAPQAQVRVHAVLLAPCPPFVRADVPLLGLDPARPALDLQVLGLTIRW
jgi:hypothetical protein